MQRLFLGMPDLVQAMNVFYFVGHFVLTGVFFIVAVLPLARRLPQRPQRVPRRDGDLARHPLAVPDRAAAARRTSGSTDTLRAFSGIDIGSPQSSPFSNPVAAVPSLHAGFASASRTGS